MMEISSNPDEMMEISSNPERSRSPSLSLPLPKKKYNYIIYSHGTEINDFTSHLYEENIPIKFKIPYFCNIRYYVDKCAILKGGLHTLFDFCKEDMKPREIKKLGQITNNMLFSGDERKEMYGENTMGIWLCIDGKKFERIKQILFLDKILLFPTVIDYLNKYHKKNFPHSDFFNISLHTCRGSSFEQNPEKLSYEELVPSLQRMNINTGGKINKKLKLKLNKLKLNKSKLNKSKLNKPKLNKNLKCTLKKTDPKKFTKKLLKYSNPKQVQKMVYKYLGKTAKLYPATNAKNKYRICDPDTKKWIHFGQIGYKDFSRHKNKKRRNNYLTRTAKM